MQCWDCILCLFIWFKEVRNRYYPFSRNISKHFFFSEWLPFLFKIISHTFVLSLWHHIELFTVCTKIFLGYNNETVKMAATEGSIIQHLVKNRSGSAFQLLIFFFWHICFVLFPSFTTGTLITEHEIVQWHNTANSLLLIQLNDR